MGNYFLPPDHKSWTQERKSFRSDTRLINPTKIKTKYFKTQRIFLKIKYSSVVLITLKEAAFLRCNSPGCMLFVSWWSIKQEDENTIDLHSATLDSFFIVYFGELTRRDSSAATKMSTRDTFILLQPQWLHPSLSKLWHQGVHFTLYWRSADADGNATAHMHLFITWSCIYISQEMSVSLFERWFPRGVSHRNKQSRQQWGCSGPIWQPGGSFMSPVRREMASWATSTRPHWSCCQSSSRTTTAAYHDGESCEDGSVCRCVWGTHTHTHTHTHTSVSYEKQRTGVKEDKWSWIHLWENPPSRNTQRRFS